MTTVSEIDTHIYGTAGANGGTFANPGANGGIGGDATEEFDNDDNLGSLAAGGLTLAPIVTGGYGGNGEGGDGGTGGYGGAGGISWSGDQLGSSASPYAGAFTLQGEASGGEGGAGGSGGSSDADDNGGGGNAGGSANVTFDTLTAYDTGLATIILDAQGAGGNRGGAGYYLPSDGLDGSGGAGGDGGSASADFTNSLINASVGVALDLTADAGAGGNGAQGGAGGGGGGSGGASDEADNDSLTAPELDLQFTVEGAVIGSGGAALGPSGSSPGNPGTPGAQLVAITNSTFTLSGDNFESDDNTLSLYITDFTTVGVPTPLNAGSGGNLEFSGNRFVGEGNSTLDLQVAGGGVNVDLVTGEIAVAGSSFNTLTGFSTIDLDKNDTVEIAPGDTVVVNTDPDTIVVTAGHVGGTIDGATATDALFDFVGFTGLTLAQLNADATVSSGTTTLHLDGGTLTIENYTGGFSEANTEGAPCFRRGTLILAERGEVAVEALRIGENVVTASGALRPVVWIGHRDLAVARHRWPLEILPVRVSAHAFGDGLPKRDLWLSPQHAVYAGGALIPIIRLANGATIRQEQVETVSYWHVELDTHDVVLAEGLPAESFLDCGSRSGFANGGDFVELHPTFAPQSWDDACAPLKETGAEVQAVRARLTARAVELGFRETDDPRLHIVADGRALWPALAADGAYRFVLPAPADTIALASRRMRPADADGSAESDRRHLGVAVHALEIDGAARSLGDLDGAGWHDLEGAGESLWRWTYGRAQLPSAAREIVVRLCATATYKVEPEATSYCGVQAA
jgi:hypothetical protein